MRFAKDFRMVGKEAVKRKLGVSMLTAFIASLLGGSVAGGGVTFNFNTGNTEETQTELAEIKAFFTDEALLTTFFSVFMVGLFIGLIVSFFYGGVAKSLAVGHARFNLSLLNNEEVKVEQLFSFFSNYWTACIVSFLTGFLVFLGSLLFLVPGIILSYSYAMVPFVLAENPELSAIEAMRASRKLMSGNRWRLFCLEFSYIGWDIVASLTFGIYNLWLTPYKAAAKAEFYREISGKPETVFSGPEINYSVN